jgi:hypothetical protein
MPVLRSAYGGLLMQPAERHVRAIRFWRYQPGVWRLWIPERAELQEGQAS